MTYSASFLAELKTLTDKIQEDPSVLAAPELANYLSFLHEVLTVKIKLA